MKCKKVFRNGLEEEHRTIYYYSTCNILIPFIGYGNTPKKKSYSYVYPFVPVTSGTIQDPLASPYTSTLVP